MDNCEPRTVSVPVGEFEINAENIRKGDTVIFHHPGHPELVILHMTATEDKPVFDMKHWHIDSTKHTACAYTQEAWVRSLSDGKGHRFHNVKVFTDSVEKVLQDAELRGIAKGLEAAAKYHESEAKEYEVEDVRGNYFEIVKELKHAASIRRLSPADIMKENG